MGAVASRTSLNFSSKLDPHFLSSTNTSSPFSRRSLECPTSASSGEEDEEEDSSSGSSNNDGFQKKKRSGIVSSKSCSNLYARHHFNESKQQNDDDWRRGKSRGQSKNRLHDGGGRGSKRGHESRIEQEVYASHRNEVETNASVHEESSELGSECFCQETDCSSSASLASGGSCSICLAEFDPNGRHPRDSSRRKDGEDDDGSHRSNIFL